MSDQTFSRGVGFHRKNGKDLQLTERERKLFEAMDVEDGKISLSYGKSKKTPARQSLWA